MKTRIVRVLKVKEHYRKYGHWVTHVDLTEGYYIWLLDKSNRLVKDMELLRIGIMSKSELMSFAKEQGHNPTREQLKDFDDKVCFRLKLEEKKK